MPIIGHIMPHRTIEPLNYRRRPTSGMSPVSSILPYLLGKMAPLFDFSSVYGQPQVDQLILRVFLIYNLQIDFHRDKSLRFHCLPTGECPSVGIISKFQFNC